MSMPAATVALVLASLMTAAGPVHTQRSCVGVRHSGATGTSHTVPGCDAATRSASAPAPTHGAWFVCVGTTPGEASRAVMMGLAWVISALSRSASSAHAWPRPVSQARYWSQPSKEHDS
jgi:hypothetical protein